MEASEVPQTKEMASFTGRSRMARRPIFGTTVATMHQPAGQEVANQMAPVIQTVMQARKPLIRPQEISRCRQMRVLRAVGSLAAPARTRAPSRQ